MRKSKTRKQEKKALALKHKKDKVNKKREKRIKNKELRNEGQ